MPEEKVEEEEQQQQQQKGEMPFFGNYSTFEFLTLWLSYGT